jgi:glycosyltransferase involved in cell wall biosynthesis
MEAIDDSLFLVLPVPMRRIDGVVHVESQAVHGLSRWADNFPRVVAAMVCYPEAIARNLRAVTWEPVEGRPELATVEIVGLPYGYGLAPHFRHLQDIRRRLRSRIEQARYLCFAIGGCFGDWGAVAASIADSTERPFAVWTDRVESRVIRQQSMLKESWLRRWKGLAYAELVGVYERRVIRKAALGLFNGKDTYETYKRNVTRAFSVMDIHISAADRLPEESIMSLKGGPRLRIGYAGRAVEMKAPLQWLAVLHELAERGVDFEATWLGDGPLLETMRRHVADCRLSERVRLPGFVGDRESVLAALRSWDVLLFTHITPESPRVLLESMVSATPIVGYESLYARDLVRDFGADYLVPVGRTAELVDKLARLAADPAELNRLRTETYRNSGGFNDVAVFKQRSDLIKTYL